MSLKGLTQEELYKLKRTVGVSNSNKKAEFTPLEAYNIILKAIDKGNTRTEISKYLELTSSTLIGRTINLFKNLEPSLHHKVIYGSRRERLIKGGLIGYQQAVELSKLDSTLQVELYNLIIKKNYNWGDVLSVKQLIERSGKSFDEVIKEIDERKGLTDTLQIINTIKLKEISPKLYSKSQDNRNKFFFALTKDLFEEEVGDAYLGSTTFKIVFKNSEFKPKSSEIRELQNKIHEALKKYG